MSTWPFLSVSFPRDQPVRYFAAAFSIFATEVSVGSWEIGGRTYSVEIPGGFQGMRSMKAIDVSIV